MKLPKSALELRVESFHTVGVNISPDANLPAFIHNPSAGNARGLNSFQELNKLPGFLSALIMKTGWTKNKKKKGTMTKTNDKNKNMALKAMRHYHKGPLMSLEM